MQYCKLDMTDLEPSWEITRALLCLACLIKCTGKVKIKCIPLILCAEYGIY